MNIKEEDTISDIKNNSMKISMLKIPFTFAMFLTSLIPFISFAWKEGKLSHFQFDTINKINIFSLIIVIILFSIYISLRFATKKNIKYKYDKKSKIYTFIFYSLMFVSVLIMNIISFLILKKDINTLEYFLFYGLGFICCIFCSIYEFLSKIKFVSFSNNEIAEKNIKNFTTKIKMSDDEEISIKK